MKAQFNRVDGRDGAEVELGRGISGGCEYGSSTGSQHKVQVHFDLASRFWKFVKLSNSDDSTLF